MESSQRFALNEPTVIQELIDGEAIIADLGRGFYYSLDPIGSQVWGALVCGWSQSEIIEALLERFPAEQGTISQGIAALVDRLMEEGLLVVRDEEALPVKNAGEFLASISVADFATPVLAKYTDMEQLMLLDPIHDVDETGWPNEPGEEPGN